MISLKMIVLAIFAWLFMGVTFVPEAKAPPIVSGNYVVSVKCVDPGPGPLDMMVLGAGLIFVGCMMRKIQFKLRS